MRKSVRSTPRVVLLLTLLCGGPLIPSPTLGQAAGDERQERLQERDRLWAEAQRLRAQGQLGSRNGDAARINNSLRLRFQPGGFGLRTGGRGSSPTSSSSRISLGCVRRMGSSSAATAHGIGLRTPPSCGRGCSTWPDRFGRRGRASPCQFRSIPGPASADYVVCGGIAGRPGFELSTPVCRLLSRFLDFLTHVTYLPAGWAHDF